MTKKSILTHIYKLINKSYLSIFLLVLCLFLISSCTNKERHYRGELFVKMISLGPEFFNVEYENGKTLAEKFESPTEERNLTDEEKELKVFYEFSVENKILNKPYFHVIFKDDIKNVQTVYTTESEFSKIDTFKLNVLRDQNKRVLVDFDGERISDDMILCTKIERIEKIDGQTRWQK